MGSSKKIHKRTVSIGELPWYNNDIETLKNNLKLIKNEIKPYKNSLKSENTHNDYLIDLYLAAQKTLVNIFGEKDALNVPKMKASEILDAIKNRKWDFVNCKIIK